MQINKSFKNSADGLEAILGSIMTATEYSKTEHITPYQFTLKAGDKELHYFGTRHSRNPKDSMYVEIEQVFNKFEPEVVFVEGISPNGDRDRFNQNIKVATRGEIIERMGEPGFTLKLALDGDIKWQSPEPADRDLYIYLQNQDFRREAIFAWNTLNILPQYQLQLRKTSFEQYVAQFIETFKQSTNWQDFDYSYQQAILLCENILHRKFDVEDAPEAIDFIDPIPWQEKRAQQTVINRISEATSLFRDRKIVSDLFTALKTSDKIFVVYGASHGVMQEPALRKLFERML